MAKKYKYKFWLEVERVEVNEGGEEIGEHERGEHFGFDPEPMGHYNTIELARSMLHTFSEYSPQSITDLKA